MAISLFNSGVGTASGFLLALNLSNFNTSLLPNGEECLMGGLKYHIHEYWNHNDNNIHFGENDCSSTYTGNHWDPWNACGSSSGSNICLLNEMLDCYENNYICNNTNYLNNPYLCEVGDWSNYVGNLDIYNTPTQYVNISFISEYNVGYNDVINKSIVLHCNTNERAICAPIINQTNIFENNLGLNNLNLSFFQTDTIPYDSSSDDYNNTLYVALFDKDYDQFFLDDRSNGMFLTFILIIKLDVQK